MIGTDLTARACHIEDSGCVNTEHRRPAAKAGSSLFSPSSPSYQQHIGAGFRLESATALQSESIHSALGRPNACIQDVYSHTDCACLLQPALEDDGSSVVKAAVAGGCSFLLELT